MRTDMRWRTPLGRFVARYGVARLAADVGRGLYGQPLTVVAIYKWVGGTSTPRPTHAQRIVRLAAGALTLDDIYAHRAAVAEREGEP